MNCRAWAGPSAGPDTRTGQVPAGAQLRKKTAMAMKTSMMIGRAGGVLGVGALALLLSTATLMVTGAL